MNSHEPVFQLQHDSYGSRGRQVKFLAGSSLFRLGLKRFFRELNGCLEQGWCLTNLCVSRWGLLGLRLVMLARLSKPTSVAAGDALTPAEAPPSLE